MKIVGMLQPNVITNVVMSVADSARLPLSVSRGNAGKRAKLASSYCNELRRELDKISDNQSCFVEQFKEALSNVLGENKIGLKILPQEHKKYRGTLGVDLDIKTSVHGCDKLMFEDTDSKIVGYCMYLPLSSDGSVIENKYVALHESRHLFDNICHPKTINLRSCKFICNEEKKDAYFNIFNAFTQNTVSPDKGQSIFKFVQTELKKFSNEEAVDVLQVSRQNMKSEINSYKDELNYMLRQPWGNIRESVECWLLLHSMNYKNKINFVNKLLAEKLRLARQDIQARNSQHKN